jgi:hypothetical protein
MLLRLAVCPRIVMNMGENEFATAALRQSMLRRRLTLLLLVCLGGAGLWLGPSLRQRSDASTRVDRT